MDDLSYQILPARYVQSKNPELYLSAYRTFKETWLATFTELFGPEYTYASNDFTRQDWLQCLFIKNECVALNCIREISLHSDPDLDDMWLKPWPREVLQSLRNQGSRCLINSYFTVRADHRKTATFDQHSLSYVLGCLSVLEQVAMSAPIMLGMMRNNRSMNTLGVQWGSQTLLSNVLHNTIPSDLVLFKTSAVVEASKSFPDIVFKLFNQKNKPLTKGAENEFVA